LESPVQAVAAVGKCQSSKSALNECRRLETRGSERLSVRMGNFLLAPQRGLCKR